MTMTLVSTTTVGAGGVSSITLSSIPATGTDLLLVASLRTNTGSLRQSLPISFNSDPVGFTNRELYGTTASALSGSGNRFVIIANGNGSSGSTFGSTTMYIPNYAGSTAKSFSIEGIQETMGTGMYLRLLAGAYTGSTGGINQITISGDGQTILEYSSVSIYTITKGSGGATVS